MKSGVYMIKNMINHKIYIGSSKDITKRWLGHKNLLNKKKHGNGFLSNAWHKYGEDNFIFSVVEYVESDQLIIKEQHYIDFYKSYDNKIGYNLVPNAGSNLGWKPSEETKKKMSKSAKKKPPVTEETKKKLSVVRKGNKNALGSVKTTEMKEKQSELMKGTNRGEKNGMAITDRNEIIAMRNDYDNGMRISEIMIKYDKKNSFTYQIVKRLRWKWLD